MTRTRKLVAMLLLVAVVSGGILTAALAADNTATYAYLPDRSVYFYDVAQEYAWAYKEVDALALNGIVQGGGDHLFYPGNPITRADFIVMLDRAYGMSDALQSGLVASKGTFSDVPAGAYYAKAVNAARAFGVAGGTSDGRFLPQQKMTRQDAMVFLKRTIDCTPLRLAAGQLSGFGDIAQVASYAREAVGALVTAQVIGGSNGRLNPTAQVTRAEMAVMLYRATHMTEQNGSASYQKRSDMVNICVGAQSYCDVIIANYDPAVRYSELMRYSRLWRQNGETYITLKENQPINREGVYSAGQLTLSGEQQSYPIAAGCVAIDVKPYHQLRTLVSTGSTYRYCYPSIVNGEVTAIYYVRA